jgi:hypothetical protein
MILRKMDLLSLVHFGNAGHTSKIPPSQSEDRVMRKPLPPPPKPNTKREILRRTAIAIKLRHTKNNLLTTRGCCFEKKEEKFFNAELIKKSPNFYKQYYRQQLILLMPAYSSSNSRFLS